MAFNPLKRTFFFIVFQIYTTFVIVFKIHKTGPKVLTMQEHFLKSEGQNLVQILAKIFFVIYFLILT